MKSTVIQMSVFIVCAMISLGCQKKDENKSDPANISESQKTIDSSSLKVTKVNGIPLSYDDMVTRIFTTGNATNTSLKLIQYRYIDSGCDTYNRVYGNKEDLCVNLQIAANNNSCGYSFLKRDFDNQCPGQVWNDRKIDEYQNSTGHTVNCFFSEGNPTYDELVAKTKYTLVQMSAKEVMLLKHDNTKAIVFHSYVSGKFEIKIALYDGSGKWLGEKEESTQDQTPKSLYLEIPELPSKPSINCWPAIRTKQ